MICTSLDVEGVQVRGRHRLRVRRSSDNPCAPLGALVPLVLGRVQTWRSPLRDEFVNS